MYRPTSLHVETAAMNDTDAFELTQSPSLHFSETDIHSVKAPSLCFSEVDLKSVESSATLHPVEAPARQPSTRLLFSLLSRQHLLLLVLPAVLSSVTAGGIAPFMTYVIGQSFDAFAQFPLSNPSQDDKSQLLHGVGLAALELLGLAAGALALSSVTSALWIWTGEHNVSTLRKRVYEAVTHKEMEWFDLKMGADGTVQDSEQGPLGAGGLMAKFARETDDVRMASSLASGLLLQHLTTCLACLALAFSRSWSLTLVILSAVPILMVIQGLSQAFAAPLLATERAQTASAATRVDRAVAAIATVKAFNAQLHESAALSHALSAIQQAARRLNGVWGATSAVAQFVMMGMFVQGFWFGAMLVRTGRVSAGDVMAVFWACLIATSNLQMCIPQFIVLAKGKFAAASLVGLLEGTASRPLRKIVPQKCIGEMALHDVTFAYPARPDVPALSHVSLFIPAGETTFIVGGSGSGKTTVGQLLLGLYRPQAGTVSLDSQDVGYLDMAWVRGQVGGVGQGCVLFDMSVHENVALGAGMAREVGRAEVEEACRVALLEEFVRDLPLGYDTVLGTGGASLSGGQRQRVAIARARVRNPTVLILDEATSGLDATSRVLVLEAVKRWRAGKTTVVITHELSQIGEDEFVYVMKGGMVVEQGYRGDLESVEGEFGRMAGEQGSGGGLREEKAAAAALAVDTLPRPSSVKHQSLMQASLRPLTMGNWMFDVVRELTKEPEEGATPAVDRFVPAQAFAKEMTTADPNRPRRPSSIQIPSFPPPPAARASAGRRLSLQFSPTSPVYTGSQMRLVEDDESFEGEKQVVERSGTEASRKREGGRRQRVQARWDAPVLETVKVEEAMSQPSQESVWTLIRQIYPTVPHKGLVAFGVAVCVLSGAMTPIFSFLLSRLLFEVSIGGRNTEAINMYGGIVLGVAATDGLLMGLKYFVMESAGMSWLTRIRKTSFARVLAQDKKWFDKTENAPVQLVQVLIKDGDDARTLIATVLGQCVVVVAMLGVGLVWALVQGWQLTLVGFAIAPLFAITMAVQTNLVAKCELRNKRAREDVAKGYYEAISNIRAIRSMSFEGVFQSQFEKAVDRALSTGVRGALVEGCTYGVASALIYIAEAILFYVGAVLIARGTYTYLQMVEVLNLVVFTVTIGSQLMAFTQKIAKSIQATRDFNRLLRLSADTDESKGVSRPAIMGAVSFNAVSFSYPERPDVKVLKNVSLKFSDSECVAVVGSSGSGKSTVAALLQRLYEPDAGMISIGASELRSTDVEYLREHVAVVSQNPNLFDATVAENIAYGTKTLSAADTRRAAKAANVHDFIMSLPQGYDTMVGENASLISGGQAQRLQIARALARPSKILILDECTSALDSSNQAAVIDTIRHAKVGRTTVMVTHKLPVMRMCDRIVVMHEGEVAEEGTYEALMERNGVFASLARGGEWVGE